MIEDTQAFEEGKEGDYREEGESYCLFGTIFEAETGKTSGELNRRELPRIQTHSGSDEKMTTYIVKLTVFFVCVCNVSSMLTGSSMAITLVWLCLVS